MTRILVLRPEPGASATLERARAIGLDAVSIPLFAIEPVPWQAPDPAGFDGLLITSANAIRAGGRGLDPLRGLPAHAVGEATAEAARAVGFAVATTGAGGIDELLATIDPALRLLHLTGEDRIAPTASGRITTVIVYRARQCDDVDLSGVGRCVALVHSLRAARRLAELMPDRSEITVAAISEAAAEATGSGWAQVAIADAPSDQALLALAARLCNSSALS